MLRLAVTFVAILSIVACKQNAETITTEKEISLQNTNKLPINVILLIGDGMGLSQVSSSYYYSETTPNFSRFKQIGLINTSSASHKITDSGAGGTAFSIGEKTYNGAVGVDVDSLPSKNLIEIFSEQLYSTGIVVTCQLPHATPADFFAHVKFRKQYEDIAKQFVYSEVDYFAGGGYQYFINREDGVNYLDSLTNHGFTVDTNDLQDSKMYQLSQKWAYLLAPDALPSKLDGRGNIFERATQNAIDFLSLNEKGFFLMVEGSQIDWECHSNNAKGVIEEVLDFDKAVGIALDYAESNDHTLVIVLADHETGGFALTPKASDEKYDNYNEIDPGFAGKEHTATLIPVFAFGPNAERFNGIYQNSDIFNKILEATR
ncbi:MAG: alkaline phosphatase [Bacteroidales bacterium]|nr:alkaline phosphatase [Bacteroidales bacterium]